MKQEADRDLIYIGSNKINRDDIFTSATWFERPPANARLIRTLLELGLQHVTDPRSELEEGNKDIRVLIATPVTAHFHSDESSLVGQRRSSVTDTRASISRR